MNTKNPGASVRRGFSLLVQICATSVAPMSMKPACIAVILALLTACAPDPAEGEISEVDTPGTPGAVPAEIVPDGQTITSVGDLIGEYRVAGIDDGGVPQGQAIALSIDGPVLSFEPTCAGFVWEIGFEGESLSTQRQANPQDRPAGSPPPPVCAVAVSPGQIALAQSIDAATRAERTPANAVRLSGGGRSVTLFSQ